MKIYTISRMVTGGCDIPKLQGLSIHVTPFEEPMVKEILKVRGILPTFITDGCVTANETKFCEVDHLPSETVKNLKQMLESAIPAVV